ncbi:MAG: chromosome segregation protein SMC [Lachnospiraceae bacterium]|nr:chromosome segregation protein SMC [Lachnospiraceae bacterium]
MFLKSVELQGFKSFAQKQVFEFNKGITAIVGPNGSGKSNVADAVRWVLGEQSAKQLRSSRMEDVIFSGTDNRKPLGFAYVAITFDNSDHALNIEYDTVTVSRRVYRSGESEYRMNGNSCRLRDIQELFMDTGIGKEGYSIISQGRIDRILSGKPEDRRELFDEAAGIVKFKKRKALTEKNLEEERANLTRITDIIHELELTLGPLKKQSETAKKFLSLRDELKKYDANIYLMSFGKLKADAEKVEERLAIVNADIEERKAALEGIKDSYEEISALIDRYSEEIESIQAEDHEASLSLEKIAGRKQLSLAKRDSYSQDIARLDSEIASSSGGLEEKRALIEASEKEAEILSARCAELEKEIARISEGLAETRDNIARIRVEIDENSQTVITCLNEETVLSGRAKELEVLREQYEKQKEELLEKVEELRSSQDSSSELLMDLKSKASKTTVALTKAKSEVIRLSTAADRISRDIADSWDLYNDNEKKLHEARAQYSALKSIAERYEGYQSSVRSVMEKKSEYPGIIGVVADIIHVGKKYETAIETALGGSISNIVTENEKTAKALIEYLKSGRLGRAVFLPVSAVKSERFEFPDEILSARGVIGPAVSLVTCSKKYEGIVNYLLGKVLVADNMDHALALSRSHDYSLRIVTLEGESLKPGGSISGGAYRKNSFLLSRGRRLEELTAEIDKYMGRDKELSERIENLQEEKSTNRSNYEEKQKALSELTIQDNNLRMELKQAEESKSASEDAIYNFNADIEKTETKLSEIDSNQQALESDTAENAVKKATAEESVKTLGQDLGRLLEEEKSGSDRYGKISIDLAQEEQKLGFERQTLERLKGEEDSAESALGSKQDDLAKAREGISEAETELTALAQEELALNASREDIKQRLEDTMQQKASYTEQNRSFFERRESLSDDLANLDKEQFRLSSQKEKIEENRTALSNYMWEEYELTFRLAQPFADEELQGSSLTKLRKTADDLKKEIRNLGDVNVHAVEEYKERSDRYELLKSQHDDVVETEKKLVGIIRDLDRCMEQQFEEKFSSIQEQFSKTFSRLFGGGKGTLILSDPDDLLNTGVIINVQPPGKRLQNMMQLSGGEKALTAIALLFAILALNPSPFCLLDEIEAALDDANVKRFAEYLRDFTDETQFIVITHRRGTMNEADVLYGITMQEKGISTLVSVNLIEDKLS